MKPPGRVNLGKASSKVSVEPSEGIGRRILQHYLSVAGPLGPDVSGAIVRPVRYLTGQARILYGGLVDGVTAIRWLLPGFSSMNARFRPSSRLDRCLACPAALRMQWRVS